MTKLKIKDAGAEYAEIWGEAIHTNRHLRVISVSGWLSECSCSSSSSSALCRSSRRVPSL